MTAQEYQATPGDFRLLPPRQVEVSRSFSYKLNVGNYESRDFFCSQKATCTPEDAAAVSEELFTFCRTQVQKDVTDYKRMAAAAKAKQS